MYGIAFRMLVFSLILAYFLIVIKLSDETETENCVVKVESKGYDAGAEVDYFVNGEYVMGGWGDSRPGAIN